MFVPKRECQFCIPTYNDSEEYWRTNQEQAEGKVVFVPISEEEDDSLFPVYSELNSVLGIVIGPFEEEYIEAADAPRAAKIVRRWQERPESDVQAAALIKLQRALEIAIEYGTYVELAL